LNGTHQILVHADEVNMLHENINTIKKNVEALLKASRGDGLKVNREVYGCGLSPTCRQNHNLLIANRASDNVAKFTYMGKSI
jgi:hypothetical protein